MSQDFHIADLDEEYEDDTNFNITDVNAIVKGAINRVMQDKLYVRGKIHEWNAEIIETCMDELIDVLKPFKVVLTSVVVPKFGNGVHAGHKCVWNEKFDGSITMKWENPQFFVIVSVFGASIFETTATDYFNRDIRPKRRINPNEANEKKWGDDENGAGEEEEKM